VVKAGAKTKGSYGQNTKTKLANRLENLFAVSFNFEVKIWTRMDVRLLFFIGFVLIVFMCSGKTPGKEEGEKSKNKLTPEEKKTRAGTRKGGDEPKFSEGPLTYDVRNLIDCHLKAVIQFSFVQWCPQKIVEGMLSIGIVSRA